MIKVLRWMRQNLFSTWFNTILTIVLLYFVYIVVSALFNWAVLDATWIAPSKDACNKHGACWAVITDNYVRFLYGLYPPSQRWRVNLSFGLALIFIVPLFIRRLPNPPRTWLKPKLWIGLFDLIVLPAIIWILLSGGIFGLPIVESNLWGGLSLTMVLSVVVCIGCFILGIFLALGRQSTLPAIKALCVVYIEIIRSVPLITVLFMATTMIPLFAPKGSFDVSELTSVIVGMTLFGAAYMAEIIRAGLQGLSHGQLEASRSLGLGYWKTRFFILLPQAITISMPNIISFLIGTFKGTSLVYILGMVDFLGVTNLIQGDINWAGLYIETLSFISLIYFVFCFSFSRYGVSVEKRLQKQDTKI